MNNLYAPASMKPKHLEKKLLVFLLTLFGLFPALKAQDVTITSTGGSSLAADYRSLTEAFQAINAGTHKGDIIVNINADIDEGNVPAILNSNDADPADYTSVTIRPTLDNLTVYGSPDAGFGVIE